MQILKKCPFLKHFEVCPRLNTTLVDQYAFAFHIAYVRTCIHMYILYIVTSQADSFASFFLSSRCRALVPTGRKEDNVRQRKEILKCYFRIIAFLERNCPLGGETNFRVSGKCTFWVHVSIYLYSFKKKQYTLNAAAHISVIRNIVGLRWTFYMLLIV